MNRLASVLCLSLSGVFAAAAAAQTQPDFSGQWTTAPEPTPTAQTDVTRGAAGAPTGAARGASGARARGGMRQMVGDMGSGWGSTLTITQDATRLAVEYAFFSRGDMQLPLRFLYALGGSLDARSVLP